MAIASGFDKFKRPRITIFFLGCRRGREKITCSLVLVIDCGCCGDGCEGGCVGVLVVVGLLALVVVVVVDLRFGVWSSKHTHDRRPRINKKSPADAEEGRI